MKKGLFFLLTINLFSAKIGFINSIGANCIYPGYIKTVFENAGHTIECTTYGKAHKYDLIISQNILTNDVKIANKTILVILEPKIIFADLYNKEIINKYRRVYTFEHEYCTNKRYVKMFYPWLVYIDKTVCNRALNDASFYQKYPYNDIIKISNTFVPFNKRKLACMINSILKINSDEENYSKRLEVGKFYNKNFPNDLTLYGSGGWDEYHLSIYRGFCNWDDRSALFRGHKFCYCYENWENNLHYISEKIQTCFQELCVPIYKGCNRITDYIPKETFINANDFNSTEEIHDFISKMDEETWMGYINAMREFVISDDSNVFTVEYHAQHLLKTVEEVLAENN